MQLQHQAANPRTQKQKAHPLVHLQCLGIYFCFHSIFLIIYTILLEKYTILLEKLLLGKQGTHFVLLLVHNVPNCLSFEL